MLFSPLLHKRYYYLIGLFLLFSFSAVNDAMKCKKLPDIMIVGMEKCGTASVRLFLSVHPKIFKPPSYITNEFNDPLMNITTVTNFLRDKPCTPEGMLRLERISTHAKPELLFQFVPNLKIIAIVKEPVERALSHFIHYKKMNRGLLGNVPDDFDRAVTENEDVRSLVLFWSLYADRLRPWIRIFGMENVLVLDGDKFVTDPVTELKKAEIFIGIPPKIRQDNFIYSKEKGFYCVNNNKGRGDCLSPNKGRPHPVMKKSTRQFLTDILKPSNEIFYQMIGRRFPWN